jgi:uncharacterized membrane protein
VTSPERAPRRELPPVTGPTDHAVDQLLGNLLRVGVIVSAAVATLGGILYLIRHGAQPVDYRVFRGEPEELRHVRSIVAGALRLRPESIVQLGLLLLIATPVARVAFGLVAFALQRDRVYVLITAIVLAILVFSLMGGRL